MLLWNKDKYPSDLTRLPFLTRWSLWLQLLNGGKLCSTCPGMPGCNLTLLRLLVDHLQLEIQVCIHSAWRVFKQTKSRILLSACFHAALCVRESAPSPFSHMGFLQSLSDVFWGIVSFTSAKMIIVFPVFSVCCVHLKELDPGRWELSLQINKGGSYLFVSGSRRSVLSRGPWRASSKVARGGGNRSRVLRRTPGSPSSHFWCDL